MNFYNANFYKQSVDKTGTLIVFSTKYDNKYPVKYFIAFIMLPLLHGYDI